MLRFRIFIGWIVSLTLLGCAVAPLTTGMTGRSLAKGALELDSQIAGYADPGTGALVTAPSARLIYGLGSGWNIAAITELQTITGILKYSLLDSEADDGLSLALLGAAVGAVGRVSYFAGAVVSYLTRKWEPYLVYRFHVANVDRTAVNLSFFNGAVDSQFSFSTISIGGKYWWTPSIGMGIEGVIMTDAGSTKFSVHNLLNFQVSLIF